MKKFFFLIFVLFILVVIFLAFLFIPLYKSAKHIANQKMVFNTISNTKGHAEISLNPTLFAGKGAIIPLNTLINVGPASIDVDMSDRSMIRFSPKSKFKILQKSKKNYSIKLLQGGLAFSKNEGGSFKGVITPKNKVLLTGTQGMISVNGVKILTGSAQVNGKIKIGPNEAFKGGERIKLDPQIAQKVATLVNNIKPSDQKDVWSNVKEHLPKFYEEISINQSSLRDIEKPKTTTSESTETEELPVPISINPLDKFKNYIEEYFKKKIEAYNEMYMLRLAVTTERYYKADLSFPATIDNLMMADPGMTHDPWGTHYLYTLGGPAGFNLRSAGPDRAMNTADDIVLFTTSSPHSAWIL